MRGDEAVARVAGRTKAEELATRQERLTSARAERANAILRATATSRTGAVVVSYVCR